MQKLNLDAQKKMQKELQKYLTHKNEAKNFYASTKEISAWLQEKAK